MRREVYKKEFSSREDRWEKYCKMHKVVKEWLGRRSLTFGMKYSENSMGKISTIVRVNLDPWLGI